MNLFNEAQYPMIKMVYSSLSYIDSNVGMLHAWSSLK